MALVLIGSSAGTAKVAVDQLREQGVKAGLVKIRVFRPFPAQELAQALQHVKSLAIMDKAERLLPTAAPSSPRSGAPCTTWNPVPAPWATSTA